MKTMSPREYKALRASVGSQRFVAAALGVHRSTVH